MTELSVIFPGIKQVELRPQPRPDVGPDSVLVRSERTLISPGSELALYEGTHAGLLDPEILFAKFPHQPGYDAVGRVEACGASIEDLKPGDRLLYLGRHETWSVLRARESIWVRAPAGLDANKLLFARLVQIAATGPFCLRSRPERAVVVGAGLIGILAAQVMRAQGVKQVVVQDVNAARLGIAGRCGLRTALGEGVSLEPACRELGGEPDAIIEATGVPALVPSALAAVRRRGDVILLGSPRGPAGIDLYKQVHRKGAALIGAHEAMLPDRAPAGSPSRQALLEQAVEWLSRGDITVEGLVTDVVRPQDLPATYARIAADKQALGVVVDWS